MNSVRRKRKNTRGFTLAETLITLLILLMVASIVAGGIPSAARAYTSAMDAANAHALLSTTVNALRSELSTAWNVRLENEGDSGKAIVYFNANTGAESKIYCEGNDIMLLKYSDQEEVDHDAHPLVSDAASLKAEKFSVSYTDVGFDKEKGIVSFSGLAVSKGEGTEGTTAASLPADLLIHVIKEEPT